MGFVRKEAKSCLAGKIVDKHVEERISRSSLSMVQYTRVYKQGNKIALFLRKDGHHHEQEFILKLILIKFFLVGIVKNLKKNKYI